MINLTKNYPVPTHKTWDIHDSSKLQEYMTCPRKYFYRYVLGMNAESLNHHLIFGEAVHRALAVLGDWNYGNIKEGLYKDENSTKKGYSFIAKAYQAVETDKFKELVVEKAANEFLSYFREHIAPEYDDGLGAKTPAHFLEALPLYIENYEKQDGRQTNIFTETAGSVPVGEDRRVHFRMDQVVRTEHGKILGREHKTGSYLSPAWIEQWSTKMQCNLYLHVLMAEFGEEQVDGLEVNGIICQKGTMKDRKAAEKAGVPYTGYKFERLLVAKTPEAMQDWLWTVNWWLDQIVGQYKLLENARKGDIEMRAFPMNTESCVKYNRPCPYIGFCGSGVNPIGMGGREQPGYEITFWDPTDYREDADKILDLEEVKG